MPDAMLGRGDETVNKRKSPFSGADALALGGTEWMVYTCGKK